MISEEELLLITEDSDLHLVSDERCGWSTLEGRFTCPQTGSASHPIELEVTVVSKWGMKDHVE